MAEQRAAARTPRAGRGGKTRRNELRRRVGAQRNVRWRDLVLQPELLPLAAIFLCYVLAIATMVGVFRAQPTLAAGRVMDDTRASRIDFALRDAEATQRQRDLAEARVPRVYAADRATFEAVESSLRALPDTLAAAESYDALAPEVRDAFALTPDRFAELRGRFPGGGVSPEWDRAVDAVLRSLAQTAVLASESYQRALQDPGEEMRLVGPDGAERSLLETGAMVLASPGEPPADRLRGKMLAIAVSAGLEGAAAHAVADRLARLDAPTYRYDEAATETARAAAAAAVPTARLEIPAGEVLYRAGERLSEEQRILALEENRRAAAARTWWVRVASALGVLGLVWLIGAAVAGYLRVSQPALALDANRLAAIAALSALLLASSCFGVAWYPNLFWLVGVAPVVFFGMVLVVAFTRRVSIILSGAQALLTGLALDASVGALAVVALGTLLAGWRLSEIRSRHDLVRGGLVVAAGLGASVIAVGLVERPITPLVLREIASDAAWAAIGGFASAALTLVSLPLVERVFGVTTGMTLSELRDPRQTLLRMLQQRAPGTYNHSLNVASLAEAAADAIGADSLHVYVGALYHDIGKMNKPDYFVENQPRGLNKHDKLSPAMSLLVIVGHVKDGVELAREYGLPRSLHHYIESHHGTTLVEYFYDQAKRKADADEDLDAPAEVEYRYPGPRPRTKEAAILMLCDCVESATRAMAEPTPSRISALVRALARKRLADGQFDDSELTLRELSLLEESVTKTLSAIYHARISYPAAATHDAAPPDKPAAGPGPAATAGG